jgi:hypothetical protein
MLSGKLWLIEWSSMTETDMMRMPRTNAVTLVRVAQGNVRPDVSEVQRELWRHIGMKALPRKVASTTIQ